MRYKLKDVIDSNTDLVDYLKQGLNTSMSFGKTATQLNDVLTFVGMVVYGYFYDDLVAYDGEDVEEVQETFIDRLCYDVNVKIPYWSKKYDYVKKLLTTDDFSLLQTSKMTSSSSDKSQSAGGTLQKTATTPTGVTTGTTSDGIDITMTKLGSVELNTVKTTGFVDKYTNAQQKFANAVSSKGERSGTILREGSIDELLNVLEKLPSSFANEINIVLQKHFIFDYDGEMKGYYTEN